MTLRKICFFASLIISVGCLAGGYALADQWVGALISLSASAAWMAARKYPAVISPSISLLASVCLAAAGLINGANPILMLSGASLALAAWDLSLLENNALKSGSADKQTGRSENKHLQTLAIALGSGLALALFGRLLSFKIPFILMLALAALLIFGLEQIWSALKKRQTREPTS